MSTSSDARKHMLLIERVAKKAGGSQASQANARQQRVGVARSETEDPAGVGGAPAVVQKLELGTIGGNFLNGDLVIDKLDWADGTSRVVLVKKSFAGSEITLGSNSAFASFIVLTEDEG